jgi:hypothetical protein
MVYPGAVFRLEVDIICLGISNTSIILKYEDMSEFSYF